MKAEKKQREEALKNGAIDRPQQELAQACRSKRVTLVILGTLAAIGGCSDHSSSASDSTTVETRQHSYRTLGDCRTDWGADERNCSAHTGIGYVGPQFYWNHEAGHPVAVDANGQTRALSNTSLRGPDTVSRLATATSMSHASVSRGGFGSTSHAHSGGHAHASHGG